MTREEAIETACSIVSLAYRSMGDYSHPSDGFCRRCPVERIPEWNYSNDGIAFQYVRLAVVEKLKRDGYKISVGFDPETGIEFLGPGKVLGQF